MGSASREALAESRRAARSQNGDLATGVSLFEASRIIGSSHQLQAALGDPGAETSAKKALVASVFGSRVTPQALTILESVAAGRWSTPSDILEGIEELGLRVIAASAPNDVSLENELFAFGRAVATNSELELALSSKLGSGPAKVVLVERLLQGSASRETVAILTHLVQQPLGRRAGELVRHAAHVVADEAGFAVATVTSAVPLQQAQIDRLQAGLAARSGRPVRVNQIVDANVLGGLRVQIADDVIDGSIAKRLGDLRLQLAG